jgi:hypothetical protein
MKQKRYLVNYKWVEIQPNKVKLLDPKSGKYNLSLNEMLSNGGNVLWQGAIQIDADNENKIFTTSRFKATQDLNNTLLGGSIIQDPNKSTFFVMTNFRLIGGKVNAIGGSDNENKSTNLLSFKNVAIVGILVIGAVYLLNKQKK